MREGAPRREDRPRIPCPEVRSAFPAGILWEITEDRAREWFRHRFGWLRDGILRRGPLDRGELALLLLDLDCYEGLVTRYLEGRGPQPPPLHEYLLPGREHWGELARLFRALLARAESAEAGAEDPVERGRFLEDL